MDGVRVGFLGPSYGTTPAAVIGNKNKTDPLKALNMLMRKAMGHSAIQATQPLQWTYRFGSMEPKIISIILHLSTG